VVFEASRIAGPQRVQQLRHRRDRPLGQHRERHLRSEFVIRLVAGRDP
jgi:hypothetical protein